MPTIIKLWSESFTSFACDVWATGPLTLSETTDTLPATRVLYSVLVECGMEI
jgi:hypothetical protein